VITGDTIMTAGITPRVDGKLVWTGKVGSAVSAEHAREATALATRNAVIAALEALPEGMTVTCCLMLTVYLNAVETFERHSWVADGASSVIAETWGSEAMGVRVAVGVASLPGGSPVEVQILAKVSPAR
jgi:enamine deaminase RidA (YjgF/YER057c/UK114 family)